MYLFETDMYNRVNYNYLKEYIFGGNDEKIEWPMLFRKVIIVENQINEVEEENLTSEKQIYTAKK